MSIKINKMYLILVSVIVILLLILWHFGLIGLWSEGISLVANNTKEFSDKNSHMIDGEYLVTIDLSNLQSNIGKDLYNDGTHRIYISSLDKAGGYRIGFRSSGSYSLKGASLISGIHHATVDDNNFTYNMTAKMKVKYNGKEYTGSGIGMSGLNYKDGDEFLFSIFPSEAYDSGEISLNETGLVNITISNLFMNKWIKQ